MKGSMALGDMDLSHMDTDAEVLVRRVPTTRVREVAVIGMAGSAGPAETLEEFWTIVREGRSGLCDLTSERRADAETYLRARGRATPADPDRYIAGSRLRSIAEFDHRFFSMARQEAKFLDPNQRIFLQTAWAALEDAGLLSTNLSGERVGVYVGLSNDFGVDYRALVQTMAPDAPDVGVSGNVKSIIAGRLAFMLDLTGPSMLIDTACSSGLVALHTAFRAIQNGECTMAVVGGVKCDVLPLRADDAGIGIKEIGDTESAHHVTRTFDRSSDGTNAAEGAFAFVLKDLAEAERDGDNVQAVIVGGAVNQDGASNGITAPNASAQADLIEAALEDAGVSAEDVSYIEAHGTGTRLGDPIEVSGITKAFARHTERRQFCSIGTVKTNFGHMDCVAGLAGFAKVVLSMRDRVLPPSLHFREPNSFIDFSQSPVFVQDRLTPWTTDSGYPSTLHAGVSSFGLSGTNCHLVVRSADAATFREPSDAGTRILPLSARDEASLHRLAGAMLAHLRRHTVRADDLMFTAATGRLHQRFRVAFVYDEVADLLPLLQRFVAEGVQADARETDEDTFHGQARVILDAADKRHAADVTTVERRELDQEANLLLTPTSDRQTMRRVAGLYAAGAEIDWRRGRESRARRVSLPTYPFERTRCWVDEPGAPQRTLLTDAELVRSLDVDVLVCRLAPERNWELDEHRIKGVAVLPGTGFVEMVLDALERLGIGAPAPVLRSFVFQVPLAVDEGDEAEVHVVVRRHDGCHEVVVAARDASGVWVRHAQAEVDADAATGHPDRVDLAGLRARLSRVLVTDDVDLTDRANGLEVGERWTGSIRGGLADEDATELLYELELPESFHGEAELHHLHPALMDTLMNAASSIYDPGRLYLPLSYGRLTVHRRLPGRVHAHYRRRQESLPGQLFTYDVVVCDDEGQVVLVVDAYTIRAADALELGDAGAYGHRPALRRLQSPAASAVRGGRALLWGDFVDRGELGRAVEAAGFSPVWVASTDAGTQVITEGDTFAFAICVLGSDADGEAERAATAPLGDAMAFLDTVSHRRLSFGSGVLVAARGDAEGAEGIGQEAALGLMRVAALEYPGLRLRCLDADADTTADVLVAEAAAGDRPPLVRYRGGLAHEPFHEPARLPERDAARFTPGHGAVIVTGGTGGLGVAVVRRLAEAGVERIVVVGSHQGSDVPSLPLGHTVVCDVVRLDMGDAGAVRGMVDDVRRRHGRIAGVLHLAGRAGAGFLANKSTEQFMGVYRPKALGALHLHEATRGDDLDFFVAFSSVSAIVAEPGQSDYTAANMALDVLMQQRRAAGLPGLSLQWPAWRETGMAQRWGAVDEEGPFAPLGTDEALDLLERAMAWRDAPAVLMPGRLGTPERAPRRPVGDEPAVRRGGAVTRRVTVHGIDPVGEVEQAVADIWGSVLDVTDVEADDDFASLGGNSLLITQMLRLFDERFPGALDITDLFRFTTIAQQAAHLGGRWAPPAAPDLSTPLEVPTDTDELDRMLELLERGDVTVDDLRSHS